jgi:hypothetical protein
VEGDVRLHPVTEEALGVGGEPLEQLSELVEVDRLVMRRSHGMTISFPAEGGGKPTGGVGELAGGDAE